MNAADRVDATLRGDRVEAAKASGRAIDGRGALSLLWPAGRSAVDAPGHQLGEDAIADLRLPEVIAALAGSEPPGGRRIARERSARRVLNELVQQPEVIAHRQAVLTDLLDDPSLQERLRQVLPALEALGDAPPPERFRPSVETSLERMARRLGDLELMLEVVNQLTLALQASAASSAGLRSLRGELDALRRSEIFQSLERELPKLRATLASVRSVTIGVNLGPDLSPQSATILELGTEPIEGRRALVWRLLGGTEASRGLTPLQAGEAGPLGRPNDLVRDLRRLLSQVVGPVQAGLDRYAGVSTQALSQLGGELGLLLGAARLVERLRGVGLPMCCPTFLPLDERRAALADTYDLGLALAQLEMGSNPGSSPGIVTNGVAFDQAEGRVWVLTGPNRGGKTTYTRAVGLAQVLFQAGLYVPGSEAKMSPVDQIFTHFPTREETRPGLGRLDVEAERLGSIFLEATPHSLILLNEALAGTSALEALDLARGIVRGLRLLGARAIYVTHLHELAGDVEQINATTPGDGTVASLIAEAAEAAEPAEPAEAPREPAGAPTPDKAPTPPGRPPQRTYRIRPGAPRGTSYAAEIAEHHGISFNQLARLLRERRIVPTS